MSHQIKVPHTKSFLLLFLFFWEVWGAGIIDRNFQPGTTVIPGDTIKVTTKIWNDNPDTLKGLVYSEQIPFNIQVIYYSVVISNTNYNGIVYEQGRTGDILDNEIPYRWIFQIPPGFHEDGYLAPGDSAIIKYGLTCAVDTSFDFNRDTWYGGLSQASLLTPAFGYDSLNSVQLSFEKSNIIGNAGGGQISSGYYLSQNYPNPFNPETEIEFYIPKPGNVIVELYDITGRKINTLFESFAQAGQSSISFNGSFYASGVYFYRMTAGNFTAIKKMILIE